VNPVQLKIGIEKAVADITEKLQKMSIKIKDKSEMANPSPRSPPTMIARSASSSPMRWRRSAKTA
jgi:chaperonin GroEL (HSP60 family)